MELTLGHLPQTQNSCRIMSNPSDLEGPAFTSHVTDLPNYLRSLAACIIAGATQQSR
jgi:hypothetical protein